MPTINLATLRVKLTADDAEYKERIGAGRKQTQAFGLDLDNLGGKATLALGGAVVGAAALAAKAVTDFTRQSVQEFKVFDRQIREVYTLLPDASADARAHMSADILALGTEIGRLSDETVPALYQAISAGVPSDNVMEFLGTASDAALGGVTTLETAVDGLSSVVNAYGHETISAQQASDLMFAAVRGGKTTFDELSRSLYNVIPTASSLDLEFGNITAALAAMTSQGTPTAVATTQLRQLLVELSKDGGEAAVTFERLAGKSFTEFVAQGGNLAGALEIMSEGAADSNLRLSDMFSSVEAGNAALSLTGAGAAKFASELHSAATAAGATEAAAEIMNDSLQHQEALAAAATDELKTLIGEALEPATRKWLELKRALAETAIEGLKTGNVEDDLRASFQALGFEGEALEMRIVAARMATMELGNETATAEQQADRMARAVALLTGEFDGNIYAIEELVDQQISLENLDQERLGTLTDLYRRQNGIVEITDEQTTADKKLETAVSALARAEGLHALDIARATEAYQQNIQAAEDAAAARETFIADFEAWGTVVDGVRDPVAELLMAQDELTAAQGEWVTAVVDTSGQVDEIMGQLALDLSADQRRAYGEIMATVEEGSAAWLSAYDALQSDLTDSQRAALVAQIADLEAQNGTIRNVYTGNASEAEAAAGRIAEANAAISQTYKDAALEIALVKISQTYQEDALAAQQAFLALQVAMGTITQGEADKLLEVAEKTDAITDATTIMMDKYLEDGQLTQKEIDAIAAAVSIVEENTGLATDEIIRMAERGVPQLGLVRDSAGLVNDGFATTNDGVNTFIDTLNRIPTDIDIAINLAYTSTGTPPPAAPTNPPYPNTPHATGGYTGAGNPADIAGLVHKNEYVFSSAAVDAVGTDVLEAMHQVARSGGGMADDIAASLLGHGGGGDTIQIYTTESAEAVREMQRYQRLKRVSDRAFSR